MIPKFENTTFTAKDTKMGTMFEKTFSCRESAVMFARIFAKHYGLEEIKIDGKEWHSGHDTSR